MDPASILAIVEGAGGLAMKCVSLVKTLNDVASKFKQSKLTVLSLVQQLEIVQLAWERIDRWSQAYTESGNGSGMHQEDEKLFQRLQTSIEVGYMVIEALEEDLLHISRQIDNLGLRGKMSIVWNENALNAHRDRLGHQVQAMTCLLQTVNLEFAGSRRDVLRLTEPTLLKSDESAYSIVPSRRSSRISLSTVGSVKTASMQYKHLEFEDSLFTARVYKRNYPNTAIEQLFKLNRGRPSVSGALTERKNMSSDSVASYSPWLSSGSGTPQPIRPVDLLLIEACKSGAKESLQQVLDLLDSSGEPPAFQIFRVCFAGAVLDNRLLVVKVLTNYFPERYLRWCMEADGQLLIGRTWTMSTVDVAKQLLEMIVAYKISTAPVYLNDKLLWAASNGAEDLLSLLVKAGADMDFSDEEGLRPLHVASSYEDGGRTIERLLRYHAQIDAKANNGMTPVLYASSLGHWHNVIILVKNSADFGITDESGEQATDKLRRHSEAAYLRADLEEMRNAGIHVMNEKLHMRLQAASLQSDFKPLKAVLRFAASWSCSTFFAGLQSSIRMQTRNLAFPSKGATLAAIDGLIGEAEALLKTYSRSTSFGQVILTVTAYLLLTVFNIVLNYSDRYMFKIYLLHCSFVRDFLKRGTHAAAIYKFGTIDSIMDYTLAMEESLPPGFISFWSEDTDVSDAIDRWNILYGITSGSLGSYESEDMHIPDAVDRWSISRENLDRLDGL